MIYIVFMVVVWTGIILIMSIDRVMDATADDTITTMPMLSQQEQIELMRECLNDARKIRISAGYAGMSTAIPHSNFAAAFFEYRTR
jgi:hypothetical protein